MQYIVETFLQKTYLPVESCLLEFDVVDGEVGAEGVTGLEAGSAGEVVRTGPAASKGEISETSNINTEITWQQLDNYT